MSNTVFGPALNLLWSVLEYLKLDPESFITETLGEPVDPDKRYDPNARLPLADFEKLWLTLDDISQDKCLGLQIAHNWHPSHLGALGYAWLASSSLRTAFGRLQRYARMVSEGISFTLEETTTEFSVIVNRDPVERNPIITMDGILALLMSMCRANYGDELHPARVHFKHDEPDCSGKFSSYFCSPLVFGSADYRIVFAITDIDKLSSGTNTAMAEASDRIIIDYLAKMDKADIVDRVRREIINQLPSGGLTDDSVAAVLHISARTMQRMLHEKGMTFTDLLTEIRQNLAKKYVKDQNLSLTEISFMLGFSEMSSFSRAFKRWTGSAPSHLRR
jgi:AraC-like DNA-binding protein